MPQNANKPWDKPVKLSELTEGEIDHVSRGGGQGAIVQKEERERGETPVEFITTRQGKTISPSEGHAPDR